MSKKETYLLEIGTEELPAAAVDAWLSDSAKETTEKMLTQEFRLSFERQERWATPRRLALALIGLEDRQSSVIKEVRGPASSIAFDDKGKPTQAAQGFAKSQKIAVEDLTVKESSGGDYVYAIHESLGDPVEQVLPQAMLKLVTSFPFPKQMRWPGTVLKFPRPIRWNVSLYGEEIVDLQWEGIQSGRTTPGHRFLSTHPIEIRSADEYMLHDFELLRSHSVILDPVFRRSLIERMINQEAGKNNYQPVINPKVLNEVIHLVEWPGVALGSFEPVFLEMPQRIIFHAMEQHQRYFPLLKPDNSPAPAFLVVHNQGPDEVSESVKIGNQRVLSARLADAHFFFNEDLKTPLREWGKKLSGVTYHEKLGSMAQKRERLAGLTEVLSRQLGYDSAKTDIARTAAELCKADLVTHMVIELPSLQGVVGEEYARRTGEPEEAARAIGQHYMPLSRRIKSDLPSTELGLLISLVDKLDAVTAFLAIGMTPKGSEDPFAVRRQAMGVVRILEKIDGGIELNEAVSFIIKLLEEQQVRLQPPSQSGEAISNKVAEELLDELSWMLLAENLRKDMVRAILTPVKSADQPLAGLKVSKLAGKARALGALPKEALSDILVPYQRCKNLSAKEINTSVNGNILVEKSEKDMYQSGLETEKKLVDCSAKQDYKGMLAEMAGLRPAVDKFFEDVLVMAPEPDIKQNRLALLNYMVGLYETYADFSAVQE